MTRTELEKIAKDYIKEQSLRTGERIVDVNADNEIIFHEKLVFVLVVTKFHTVLKYTLWIDNETGEVDESAVDVKVLD